MDKPKDSIELSLTCSEPSTIVRKKTGNHTFQDSAMPTIVPLIHQPTIVHIFSCLVVTLVSHLIPFYHRIQNRSKMSMSMRTVYGISSARPTHSLLRLIARPDPHRRHTMIGPLVESCLILEILFWLDKLV